MRNKEESHLFSDPKDLGIGGPERVGPTGPTSTLSIWPGNGTLWGHALNIKGIIL